MHYKYVSCVHCGLIQLSDTLNSAEETDAESDVEETEWEPGVAGLIDTSGKGDLYKQSGVSEDISEARKLHLKHIFE